jgi:hypothetical protein
VDCHQSVAELSRQTAKMGKSVACVVLCASATSILFAPRHPLRGLPNDSEQKNWCAKKDLLVTTNLDFESAMNPLRPILFAPMCNFAHFRVFSIVIEV